MEQQAGTHRLPRVLIFPCPLQAHVNSMLKLAELLCQAGLHVTFLNTHSIQNRLLLHSDVESRFSTYPGFLFKTISDGLPDDHPRSGDRFAEVILSMKTIGKSLLKQMLVSDELGSDCSPSVTCIIADGLFGGFTADAAIELHIPIIYFRTISACCFWIYLSIAKVIEADELPIRGKEDMDRLIKNVPGMESFLRCRDLPSFCRVSDFNDKIFQFVAQDTHHCRRAQALIFNTFEDLEGPILSHIRTVCPKVYSIGPTHSHLNYKLSNKAATSSESSNSLSKVDRSCITWLDNQPSKSVIYVSFGSVAVITKDQLMEFWHGLVNSKKRFLLVVRLDLVSGKDGDDPQIPAELLDGTKERGFTVGWAPQEEVLAHPSVGGFLTHSGWNSTLESIVAGVPMICWPCLADQQVNSRYVNEVWKLGMDMKDVCDRKVVENAVNAVMGDRKEEFQRQAEVMSILATKSVSEGGSSYNNLQELIKDIRLTRFGS
ncbi:hypothetical protein FNV43_RR05788 [Rhamnella rubrinervis]|uniref:Glycosyltransferase n=1 Tax=Rhamnella rubrinervis TaxID=2594499 RepID=A0A8K0HPG1_9ROSA|nr:hypothetical protein FNV43_RR05788 [Rhamnella rubrinervis]